MKCPKCYATNHEKGALFCHICGASLAECVVESRNENEKSPSTSTIDTSPSRVMAVDLGLSSGAKWASCNLGATKPEEYGGYFAWGEVSEKAVYDWSTYTHCDGTIDSCRDIGSNICGTRYDVAHLRWGGRWQMPTSEQIKELIENCRYEWTQVNGVNGGRFIGPNGNSIFLPAAGYRDNSSLINSTGHVDVGYFAEYISGSQSSPFIEYAFCLQLSNYGAEGRHTGRGYGNVIRPVEVKSNV